MTVRSLLVLGLLACPVAVSAANFNYNYLEADYSHIALQDGTTAKGPGLDFSYTLLDGLQAVGGYARLSQPLVTDENYFLGIRGENAFGERTDFFTDILYLNNRAVTPGATGTDNGYKLRLGLRYQVIAPLELDAAVAHTYLTSASNEVSAGVFYNATAWFALGASYRHDSLRNDTTSLRLRLYF